MTPSDDIEKAAGQPSASVPDVAVAPSGRAAKPAPRSTRQYQAPERPKITQLALDLATPRVRVLLVRRARLRFVAFVLFAILGKMMLFSIILPFWGETTVVLPTQHVGGGGSIATATGSLAAPSATGAPAAVAVGDKHVGLLFQYSDLGHNASTPMLCCKLLCSSWFDE